METFCARRERVRTSPNLAAQRQHVFANKRNIRTGRPSAQIHGVDRKATINVAVEHLTITRLPCREITVILR
jgi:hypothetical protein